jgi:Cysteine rich repeat
MKKRAASMFCWLVLAASLFGLGPAAAQGTILEAMKQGCAKELGTYCNAVDRGEGRLAACLYAHDDKISTQCAVAVYDGMLSLQASIAKLDFYAQHCRADLLQHCSSVQIGEGRLYQCLVKNKPTLTDGCRDVLEPAKPELQKLGIVK